MAVVDSAERDVVPELGVPLSISQYVCHFPPLICICAERTVPYQTA